MEEFYGLEVDHNCGINGWAADAAFVHELDSYKGDSVNMQHYSSTIRQV